MAVAPLFVADMDTLKKVLKLDGVSLPAASAMIDQGVREAALKFYLRLGKSRITTLLTYTPVDDPDTDEEFLAAAAVACEIAVVRRILLPRFKVAFLEGAGTTQETWNQEAPYRAGTVSELEKELARLDAEIDEFFTFLAGDSTATEQTTIHADSIEPATKPDLPAASVFRGQRNPNLSPRTVRFPGVG